MVEIYEVEKDRKVTRNQIIGSTIISINVVDDKSLSHISRDRFIEKIRGEEIVDVQRRGKFYILSLTGGEMVVHLKLSGQLCAVEDTRPIDSGSLIVLDLSSGLSLRLIDRRRYAKAYFMSNEEGSAVKEINSMIMDPLGTITADYMKKWCELNDMPIKEAMTSRTMFAQFDDICSDELLFMYGINPEKNCTKLTDAEFTRLMDHMPVAMQWGLEVRDMASDGDDNTYSSSSHSMNVYGRDFQPCNKCGSKIRKMTVSGRNSYYCPLCQSIWGNVKRIKASDVTPDVLYPVGEFIGSYIQTFGCFSLYMIPDDTGSGIRDYQVTWEEFVAYAHDYINNDEIVNKDFGDGTLDQTTMKKFIKENKNGDSFNLGISWIKRQNWR